MKYFITFLALYFLIKFLFRIVFPAASVINKMKQKINDQDEQHFNTTTTPKNTVNSTAKQSDEYIDFEEVK